MGKLSWDNEERLKRVLRIIRKTPDIQEEFADIKESVNKMINNGTPEIFAMKKALDKCCWNDNACRIMAWNAVMKSDSQRSRRNRKRRRKH